MTSDVLSDNDDLLHQLSAELGLPSFMDTDGSQVYSCILSIRLVLSCFTIHTILHATILNLTHYQVIFVKQLSD